eukprot:13256-Eustigmatos_ZCMA.PRE.1
MPRVKLLRVTCPICRESNPDSNVAQQIAQVPALRIRETRFVYPELDNTPILQRKVYFDTGVLAGWT